MKDTIENKSRFFALYWGQQILCWSSSTSSHKFTMVSYQNYPIRQRDFLELKPLSQITDEDAIEVAKLQDWENDELPSYRKKPRKIFN